MQRKLIRLLQFTFVSFAFLFFELLIFPFLYLFNKQTHHRIRALVTQEWSKYVLNIFGMKVTSINFRSEYLERNYLIAGNHLSYLDVAIIASIIPTSFVAKKEIKSWPLIGLLASLAGIFFIDRNNVKSNVKAVFQVSRRLRESGTVQVFPEGTTGDGRAILPFKPLFFASAIRSQTPILPVTIIPQKINDHRFDETTLDIFCWHGDMTFLPHMWEMLGVKSSEITLIFHDVIQPRRFQRAEEIMHVVRASAEHVTY